MRGIKEEETLFSPMFPRLHVNDAEKGGPRAPPRNKMALYEQFSIPTQRLSSGSASTLPLLPNNGITLVPSMSASQGGGYERSVFTPFCNSHAPSQLAEKLSSYPSGGVKSSTMMATQEWKSMNSTNDHSMKSNQPLSSSDKCSFQSHNYSNFKNFSWKKYGDENDFRLPNSAHSGSALRCSNSHHSKDHENQPCSNLAISIQFQNAPEKQKKGLGTVDLQAKECMRNQTVEKVKVPQTCQDPVERSATMPSNRDRTLADSLSSPLGKIKSTKSLKRAHPSSNQDYGSNSVDLLKSLQATNARVNQDHGTTHDKTVHRDSLLLESAGVNCKQNASKLRSESCSRPSLGDNGRSPNYLRNIEDNKCGSLQVGEEERHDDVSEASMVDSVYAVDITPDDVVGIIGEKQFWKARKAIVNQQRVFAVQVFELHRLIKVQKLIAGQPHLLLEDNLYVGNTSLKVSQMKKLPSVCAIEQPALIVKPKHASQKPHSSPEIADENVVEKITLPSVNNETGKGIITPRSNCGSHSANVPVVPMATNTKPSPWCFPPPGNQWLVPVMLPSEGLVYKPYTGPCPPPAGFIAPAYGGCGPMSLSPGGGDFLKAAYGVPAHEQGIGILPGTPPLGQTYFPPYGMPVMNESISGSGVEQMSPFIGSRAKDNQFSVGDINFTFPHQSSCNMPRQNSGVISYCAGKFQTSKESEVQGSTASSPCERPNGDALPLFPTEPTVQASDHNVEANKQQTHVIKVVPHNPRSATESAARIFRSIQEGRKHYD